MENKNTRRGFTLIELLVVVLIIGILAAVSVPQYQKAVEKSKAAQGIILVKSLAQAAQAYYLANGEYATTLEQLEVSLSDAQKEEFYCNSIADACNTKEWGVMIYRASNNLQAIIAIRTSGKYKGGGFAVFQNNTDSPYEKTIVPHTLYCYERVSGPNEIETIGSYCPKLFNGKQIATGGNAIQYALP